MINPTDDSRGALIEGLRELADWLDTHPEADIEYGASAPNVGKHVADTDEYTRTVSDLDLTPTDRVPIDTYLTAKIVFSGGVFYRLQTTAPPLAECGCPNCDGSHIEVIA